MSTVSIPGNPFEIYSYTSTDNVQRKALHYNGADVYLGGIYAPTAKLDGGFDAMMQYLSQVENNFFRHWVVNYYLLDPNQSKPGTPPEPFRKRYCPFLYNATTKQWDLLSYNDADENSYFTRLRNMIASARKYNIIVQLTIFDAAGMRENPNNPEDNKMRWPWNPWNDKNNQQPFIVGATSAFPTFYDIDTHTDMRDAQINYVRKVVESTVEYWNVVYELMNEPSGQETAEQLTLRANWADRMVGVINNITKGRRLIFFNDFHDGKDVNKWKALNLPNYEALDGVIFHGDPNNVNPDAREAWHFRGDKVIQASSDAFKDEFRDDRSWSRTTANNLFDRKIIFQNETLSTEAAYGIKLATKGPSVIKRAPFLGNWDKTSGPGPDFFLQFNASGRYLAMDTANDVALAARGRLVSFTNNGFVLQPDGQAQIEYAYTLSGDTLKFNPVSDATRVQTFKRFYGPIEPFIYWWEKTGQEPGGTRPFFNLYFRPDGTFAARALDTGNILNQGTVTAINDTLGQIVFHSSISNQDETWSYRFYNGGKSMRLTNAAGDHYAIYERRS